MAPLQTIRNLALPLALLASVAACSQYKPFNSVGFIRQQYAQQVGAQAAAQLTVPFELDGEVRAAMEKHMRPVPSELRQVNQVLQFIFEDLSLHYSLTPTHDAIATFRTHQGNCLSFVNLFVGVARTKRSAPSTSRSPTTRAGTTAPAWWSARGTSWPACGWTAS